MKAKTVGLIAIALFGVVAWAMAQDGGGAKSKAGRYQFHAAQNTVIKIDTETGKTWALVPVDSPGGGFPGGGFPGGGFPGGGMPGGFGGGAREFAWVPIHDFDDHEAFKKFMDK